MLDLPPLNAVRVFEAVVRHGSFTRAAAELNMTQSAVSYQIKLLERFVGGPLLVREARGVTPNPRGAGLAPIVTRSLAELATGFHAASGRADMVLTISTMQTIASNWLAPRIGNFQMAHPGLAVRLDISNRLADFTTDGVDIAIRSGKGHWPGLASHALFDQSFIAVASPEYLAREGRPAAPADMLRHVLIAPSDSWWNIWFAKAGVTTPIRIARPGIDVETQQMAGNVAAAGHGIALVTPRFEIANLSAGRLVRLFDVTANSGLSYFLAYPQENRSVRKIALFRTWILSEIA